MNNTEDFVRSGHMMIDWLSDYFKQIEQLRVLPEMNPGDVEKKISTLPPVEAEDFQLIWDDFNKIIMPGITHWQSPGFHAYFPSNNSFPSILAELISAGIGIQGMKWITSPSATELEHRVMQWLQQMIGLSDEYKGVIMDTASVSTLCAILAAREKVSEYSINQKGFDGKIIRIYCSSEAHSSIEKAVRIAGIGSQNLVKIDVDENMQMISADLSSKIKQDLKSGYIPACIVGALGTTGIGAIDPLHEIGKIARENNIWFHVDAAFSGNALILPEFRKQIKGLEFADSLVFNPHKWMFVNFDCSAFFVKNSSDLTRTFSLVPAYLQTSQDDDIDYSNWGIQLGRRFRSLKLWFVIRSFGVEGIQNRLREHIELGKLFENFILSDKNFEMVKPRNLNIICFRYVTGNSSDLNRMNKSLLDRINKSGKIYLSHTMIDDKFVLRFVCGQTNVQREHILRAWNIIQLESENIK